MQFPKIAALVRTTRAERGVSLRELAKRTHLSHQQVLRVERGVCSVEAALRVLKELNVPKKQRVKVIVDEMFQLVMAS